MANWILIEWNIVYFIAEHRKLQRKFFEREVQLERVDVLRIFWQRDGPLDHQLHAVAPSLRQGRNGCVQALHCPSQVCVFPIKTDWFIGSHFFTILFLVYWNPNPSCVRPKHTLIQVGLIIIFTFQADEVHRQPHQLVRAHQPKTSEGRVDNLGRFQTSSRHTLLCSGKLKKLFLMCSQGFN